jgi:hypothetical protein
MRDVIVIPVIIIIDIFLIFDTGLGKTVAGLLIGSSIDRVCTYRYHQCMCTQIKSFAAGIKI